MCLEVPAKVLRERVLVYVNITSQNEVNLVVVIAENLAEESEKSAGVRRDALLAVLLHKKVEDDGMERIVRLDRSYLNGLALWVIVCTSSSS